VKLATSFPLKRITLAVALSLLVHGLLLWQWPKFEPIGRIESPPLQAKLEPLPKLGQKPVQQKSRAKPATPPLPLAEPANIASSSSAVAETPIYTPVAAAPAYTPIAAATTADEAVSHPMLPKHAALHFSVQYRDGTFKLGEVIHTLDNIDGRYILRAETRTTGLVGIFKSYQLTQTSTGSVNNQGLRPDSYTETKTDGSGTQISTARFDWDAHKIHFENRQESALPEHAQDILSLPYHLSQLPLDLESFPISLSNGKNIKQYFIGVGKESIISTAMGELRTIPMYRVQSPNEDGLIIWLALEYRLLPVKIQYLDKSGAVSANMVITDIRVSDE